MGRSENVAIFEDTRKLYQTDPKLAAAIGVSNHMQEVIPESSRCRCIGNAAGCRRIPLQLPRH